MCLPDQDYQTFAIVEGRRHFIPNRFPLGGNDYATHKAYEFGYEHKLNMLDDLKRAAAKRHVSADVFPALRAQDYQTQSTIMKTDANGVDSSWGARLRDVPLWVHTPDATIYFAPNDYTKVFHKKRSA